MADMRPHATLRQSRDAMARKRERNPGWVGSCLCKDGGNWARVAVPEQVYNLRCRNCGIVSHEY